MTELLAGVHWLNFTATSLSDASEASTASTEVLILASRDADDNPLLTVTISGDDWSLGWNTSATFSVTVENDGNEQVSGFLLLAGESTHDLYPEWNLIENGQPISAFSVAPGASSTYALKLRPNGEPTVGTLDLRIEASGTLSDGHGFAVSSETVRLTVEFEPATPTEAVLWEGGPLVNAANLAIGMFSGWLFAALLLLWMRRGAKLAEKERIDSAWDEASEEASKDDDLSAGEIRAVEDGTARCHACEARIMLPSDKEPPFRFKCPTCEEMNRVVGPREED
jgi:phage FluMu protein Com